MRQRAKLEHSVGSEETMDQKTTDAMVQSHDCLVLRVCQEAYVEAQQHLQFISDVRKDRELVKRAFVLHRNAVTTAVKRTKRTNGCDGREREEMLKERLEKNVTLCLHINFCRNRETSVDPLPCCKQRVDGQRCWRTASSSVRMELLQDTETDSADSMSQEEEEEIEK